MTGGDSGPASPDPTGLARLAPGSADWAKRLNDLDALEPTERRAELIRLAGAVRSIIHRMVEIDAPLEVLASAADAAEGIQALLDGQAARSKYEGFAEAANAGEPIGFFDHSPMLGRANPLAPPIRLQHEDDLIVGEANFGAAYEGPPGCVHGGYIAAAFDEVLGSAQSMSGAPGMTGRLTVHYRSPTPLMADLRFEGWLENVSGRKILTKGRLLNGETLCAEAEGLFISVDVAKFAAMRAERDGLG